MSTMTTPPPAETAPALMGVAEVARLTGMTPAAVRARLHRGAIPAPIARYGQSPVWDAAVITAWAGPTGTPPRATRRDAGRRRPGPRPIRA